MALPPNLENKARSIFTDREVTVYKTHLLHLSRPQGMSSTYHSHQVRGLERLGKSAAAQSELVRGHIASVYIGCRITFGSEFHEEITKYVGRKWPSGQVGVGHLANPYNWTGTMVNAYNFNAMPKELREFEAWLRLLMRQHPIPKPKLIQQELDKARAAKMDLDWYKNIKKADR